MRRRILRSIASISGASLAGQIISVSSVTLLARFYEPTAFGMFAIYISILNLVKVLVSLRLETLIVPQKSVNCANKVTVLGMVTSAIFCVVFFIPFVLLTSILLHTTVDFDILFFAYSCGIFSAYVIFNENRLNYVESYGTVGLIRFFQPSCVAIVTLIMAYLGISQGLVYGHFIAVSLLTGFIIFTLRGLSHHIPKRRELLVFLRKNKATIKFLYPAALVDTIGLQIPVLLIGALFSLELAGQFGLAWRLLITPTGILGGAIAMVFFKSFAKPQDAGLTRQARLITTWKWMLIIGVAPVLVILLHGDKIFVFALGEPWLDAGRMAMVLSIMVLAIFVSSPTSRAAIVIGMHKAAFIVTLCTALYRIGALLIGYYYSSLMIGLVIWVACEILAIIIYNWMVWRASGKDIA